MFIKEVVWVFTAYLETVYTYKQKKGNNEKWWTVHSCVGDTGDHVIYKKYPVDHQVQKEGKKWVDKMEKRRRKHCMELESLNQVWMYINLKST